MFFSKMGHLVLCNKPTIHKDYVPTSYFPPIYLHTYQPTHLLKCTTYPPTYLNVLPTYLFTFLFIHPPTYLCTYILPNYLLAQLFTHPPTYILPTYLWAQVPTHLHIYILPTYPPTHPPINYLLQPTYLLCKTYIPMYLILFK